MTAPPPKPARPLSPHLQVYRLPLPAIMSILHRITGIGLCAALPVLVAWLAALSRGPDEYAKFMTCLTSPIGKLFLLGWSWALCYHFCTGIRHLFWDAGIGLELKQVDLGGKITLGVSIVLTFILWFAVLSA